MSFNSDTFKFIEQHVLSITELTRTNKLSEILDSYVKESGEVYVVQNSRNKEARAVIVDLDFFKEYKEAVEHASDEMIEQEAEERLHEPVDIPLHTVIDEFEIDMNKVFRLSEEIEIDDE